MLKYISSNPSFFTSEGERPSESIDDIWLLLLLARFVKYTASLLYGSLIQGFFCYMVYFLPVRNGMSFQTKEYF